MDPIFSSAASTARRLTDVKHRLGIAVHAGQGSWAIAVVCVDNGEVLAWDGWYFDTLDDTEQHPLDQLGWDEWDDMPSKLLFQGNAAWLANHLGLWLMPTYSVARNAADLIVTHFNSQNEPETAKQFRASPVVAYLPIVDEEVLLAQVGARSADVPTLAEGALSALREALDLK